MPFPHSLNCHSHRHTHTNDPLIIKLSEYLKTCVLVFLDGGRIKSACKKNSGRGSREGQRDRWWAESGGRGVRSPVLSRVVQSVLRLGFAIALQPPLILVPCAQHETLLSLLSLLCPVRLQLNHITTNCHNSHCCPRRERHESGHRCSPRSR